MNSNKEITILAARSIGIKGDWFYESGGDWVSFGISWTDENDCNQCFSPLLDSSDAWSLAIEHNMRISVTDSICFADPWGGESFGEGIPGEIVSPEQGKHAATRRAITRAAAALAQTPST